MPHPRDIRRPCLGNDEVQAGDQPPVALMNNADAWIHPDHGLVGTQIRGITETGEPRRGHTVDHPLTAEAIAMRVRSASRSHRS
jgi:hypothetical protein